MRPRATKIKPLERRSILRPTNQWPKSKKLIDRLFAVVNVPAAQAVSLFEIERRDYLSPNNQIAQARRVFFYLADYVVRKLVAPCGPITLFQLVRRKLHVNRHHVFACRRERGIV